VDGLRAIRLVVAAGAGLLAADAWETGSALGMDGLRKVGQQVCGGRDASDAAFSSEETR
jgi:hypothetical protein